MNKPGKWSALKISAVAATLLLLGGCVYGPDYGYVRGDGYNGDAYYGAAAPAYYGSAYGYGGYGPYGYGYGYGPSIGLGFYYDNYGHRHYRGGHGHDGWNGHGGWNGHNGDGRNGHGWTGTPRGSAPIGRSGSTSRGSAAHSATRSAPSFSRGSSSTHRDH